MDQEFYIDIALLEDRQFWFVARRHIVAKILTKFNGRVDNEILEVGCGSGGNLGLLTQYGRVYAFESNAAARALADKRGVAEVKDGLLPDHIPFHGRQFDIIAMLDVLEHIADDAASLRALNSRLKPNGIIMVTVPAYQFLWGNHDVVNHHKRRYVRKSLEQLISQAGLSVVYSTYFNTFLFPAVLAIRLLKNTLFKSEKVHSDLFMPSKLINALLTKIMSSESLFIPRYALPFGLSLLAVARRQRGNS
jgi:2-polyprenyl-3-methyl-5-hydroxy-6-metoxy-1,4-benzoquinol methylase